MINLGSIARDKITGFVGVVIAKTEWLNGCRRFTIQPQELKDGRPIEACSFDEQQVDEIEGKPATEPAKRPGGPFPEPAR